MKDRFECIEKSDEDWLALNLTEKLNSMLSTEWKIEQITFRYDSKKAAKSEATLTRVEGKGLEAVLPLDESKVIVKLSKDSSEEVIESVDDDEFKAHMMHYKNLPIPGTSTAEFIYLDNPDEYENISAQFWDFVSGRSQAVIAINNFAVPPHLVPIIRCKLLEWVSMESRIIIPGTRLPRLFIDSCMITVTHTDVEITTLAREFLDLEDLTTLQHEIPAKAFMFTPFWLSPKYPKDQKVRERLGLELDPLFGFCLLDVQKRDFISFAVRTIRQCTASYGKPWRNDVSFFIAEMLKESLIKGNARTILAAPALNSDYTIIPWIMFACASQKFQRELLTRETCGVTIPEFFALGYPGLPGEFNSFQFKRQAQSAATNMRIRCLSHELVYNLRFDLSPGQPVLHVDFQIFGSGHGLDKIKILSHVPVSLEDLWKSSRDLYLGFLAAGGYDSFFDRLIEKRLDGFHRVTTDNAATAYPLILRVHIKPKEDWLRANVGHLNVLLKIAGSGLNSLSEDEKKLIPALVVQKLVLNGGFTLSGEMLATRLRSRY